MPVEPDWSLELSLGRRSTAATSLVDIFLRETANPIDRSQRALAEGDLGLASQVAHSIRGSSGAFGARRLSALGAAVEEACEGPGADPDDVVALDPPIKSELKSVQGILSARMPSS